jgi:hypothetical protein
MNPVEQKIALQLGMMQLQIAQMAAQIEALTEENARLKAQATPATPKAINGEAHAGH